MSFIFELLIEFIIQFFVELFVEVGAHRVGSNRSPLHPIFAFVVYLLMGAGLGFVSCIFFQQKFLSHPFAQYANIAITPIFVGLAMGAVGAWRLKRGTQLVSLDKFFYGYTFALAFALMRYAATGVG